MAGTGFGLPTSLLNLPTASSSPQAHLQIPPPPNFAEFRFQSIGQQPGLLKRFSEPDPAREHVVDEHTSMSPEVGQRYRSIVQDIVPRTRPPLLQPLIEPNATFANGVSVGDKPLNQAPGGSSQFPVAKSTPSTHVSHLPFGASESTLLPKDSSALIASSSNPDPNPATRFPVLTSPLADSGRSTSIDMLGHMQLGYPSASPGPSSIVDHPMLDVQPTHTPERPSVPPHTRKYEPLRQIQSRLQAVLTKVNPPNLASAILLTKSAQQRTDKVYAEARCLHSFSQDIMHAAQKGVAAAETILEAAEQAKGIADGAKAELDRVSSKEANQQRTTDANEVRELIQAVGDWISHQEADEAALRVRRIQQFKLRKQKAELAKASAQPTFPLSSSPTTAQLGPSVSTSISVPVRAPVPRQPLFFSTTPEVDVKAERAGSQLPQPPSSHVPLSNLSQRQADLRKKLEQKRHSAEAESRAASPLELEQQRLEDEKRRKEEEQRRENMERKEIERREEERKREEQKWKEIITRKEAERKARVEEEIKAREKVQREEEAGKLARKRAEAEKAREAVSAPAARQVAEGRRKAEEYAETQRKAQAEEEKKRPAFLNQQREAQERAGQQAAGEKRRKFQEEQDRERRLLEEQSRMKAEREHQDMLFQEQEIRRQQIQAEKNKSMADRAQQILAQRGHRLHTSLDATSEMSLDSSPGAPTLVVNSTMPLPIPNSNDHPLSPLDSHSLSTVPSLTHQVLPKDQGTRTGTIATSPSARNMAFQSSQYVPAIGQQSSMGPPQPVTPSNRQVSLPPVAHFSPIDSTPPLPPHVPISRSTMSVYRHSGDSGNVPYRETLKPSPQAQVANLKHIVDALNLPTLNAIAVKSEPVQDDSTLLYPSGSTGTEEASVRPHPSQPQAVRNVEHRHTAPHHALQTLPPITLAPVASQPTHLLPAKPMNGSHTSTILDRRISSSSLIDVAARNHPQQSQQQQAPKDSSQAQLTSRWKSSSSPQNSCPELRNDLLQQPVPVSTTAHTRSESPFRMGPDTLAPQPSPIEIPSDGSSDNHAPHPSQPPVPVPAPQPPYRGRLEPSESASAHWDHYSPPPPARSPPRGTNAYRPNFTERSRSPTLTGRKRSRDHSPVPVIRDYRDYDDRRPPFRRHSRSPSPRRSRRPSPRSPSPIERRDRPPLYARLGQIGDDTYRPSSPPRELKPSRPDLIDRFTDLRSLGAPPTRPGRGRGKRGRGGPLGGQSQSSLEQRISSGTLMNRLEDPPRRS